MSEFAVFARNVALIAGIPLVVLAVVAAVVAVAGRIRWARNFDASASMDFDEEGR